MDHIDDRIKALQKRSLQVLPLHYRRETPPKLLPVEALCEYDTDEVHLGLLNVKNFQTSDLSGVCCLFRMRKTNKTIHYSRVRLN